MARQIINVGTAPNDGTGDTLKTSFSKCNANFLELYSGSSITIADTPPGSPTNGSMWWESDTGILWISFNDGTSTQWVAVGGGAPSNTITNIVVQKFTSSTTYTPTAGMKFCIIECIGGGGGGGGATGLSGQYYVGGGGGSGGYSRKRATAAEVGASQAVTIGAYGAAGGGAVNGGAGGATSVGTLCLANGGPGGLFGSSGQVATPSGTNAPIGTGDIASTGSPGMAGMYMSSFAATIIGPAGAGGSSVLGGGAPGISASTPAATGFNASGYGSGGGGGSCYNSATVVNGGIGGSGIVIITEYI